MKKLLASTLAILMTASLLASCGDTEESSSVAEDTSSTAAAASEADESSAAESEADSAAEESAAESTTDESAESTESSADAVQPVDISEMPASLANYETEGALTFSTDMDVNDFVAPFAEDMGNGAYVPNTDESHIELSIEELEGIPMIRVQTLDMTEDGANYAVPKIQIDMSKLFAGQEELLPEIFTIRIDVVTKAVGNFFDESTNTEKLVPGNFMGAVATQPSTGDGNNSWNEMLTFNEAEWTSEWASYELNLRPGIKEAAVFVDTTDPQYLSIMKWSIPNQADYYIADIVFEDEDGNVIECNYGK